MTEINFKTTRHEFDVIQKISHRAATLFAEHEIPVERNAIVMDITATHANGTPLRLEALLGADEFNFAHDIFGIRQHLDRETGRLDSRFLPRFSA